MAQLKITLPDAIRAKLDAAAAKSGYSLAEEIRSRLERTFADDELDQPTRDFLDGLKLIPAEIERETGALWHSHAGAFAVFRQAILSRLARLRSTGGLNSDDVRFGERPHQSNPGADPQDIGISIEHLLWEHPDFTRSRLRVAMEESYRQILKLHREREGDGQ
jgi:hypothetical protein